MSQKAALAKRLRESCVVAFRGTKPKGRYGFATDAGYFGAGLYYSTARDIAKWYADHDDRRVVERCVTFQNPLIIGVRQAHKMAIAYGTAEKRAGGGVAPLRTVEAKAAADKLTADLRRRGHDGLVVVHTQSRFRKEPTIEIVDLAPPGHLEGHRRRRTR
jgi:hypothetical protein